MFWYLINGLILLIILSVLHFRSWSLMGNNFGTVEHFDFSAQDICISGISKIILQCTIVATRIIPHLYSFFNSLVVYFFNLLMLLNLFVFSALQLLRGDIFGLPGEWQIAFHIVEGFVMVMVRAWMNIFRRCTNYPFLGKYSIENFIYIVSMANNTKLQVTKILQSSNHYQVLGVSPKATQIQIKEAYKSNVLKYHPDKTSIPQAKQIFGKVTNAYQKLSQSQERVQYDEQLLRKSKQTKNNSQNFQPSNNERTKRKDSNPFRSQFRNQKMNAAQQNKRKYDAYFKPPPNPYNPKRSQQSANNKEDAGEKNDINPPRRRIFQNKSSNLTTLILSLILFYIFWSLMPGYTPAQPRFVFMRTQEFSLKMKTQRYGFVFFIKPENANKTAVFQQQVELVFLNKLQKECQMNLKMNAKHSSLPMVNPFGLKTNNNQQLSADYKSCKKLLKLIKKYPEIRLKRFPHLNN